MIAKSLLAKLNNLILAGQNDEGELEWMGTINQWREAEIEEKLKDIVKQYPDF